MSIDEHPLVTVASAVGVIGFGDCLWLAELWLRQWLRIGGDRHRRERLCYRTALILIATALVADAILLADCSSERSSE